MKDCVSARIECEIAHGFVRSWTNHMHDDYGYALFPSSYSTNKHTLVEPGEADSRGIGPLHSRPDYIYASPEINAYGERFIELSVQARKLIQSLLDDRNAYLKRRQ